MPPRRRRAGAEGHYQLEPVLEANLDAEAARMHAILEPTQAMQACRDTNVECPGANARVPLRLRDTDLTFRNKPA